MNLISVPVPYLDNPDGNHDPLPQAADRAEGEYEEPIEEVRGVQVHHLVRLHLLHIHLILHVDNTLVILFRLLDLIVITHRLRLKHACSSK